MSRIAESARVWPLAKLIGDVWVGAHSMIDDYVFINCPDDQVYGIGRHIHIAVVVTVMGGGPFHIEDYAGISAKTSVWTGSDDYTGGGLTGPTVEETLRNCDRSGVFIGRHAVVGSNCVLLPGTHIEEGATIGAGSVVRGRVPAWEIYAGSIAKKIGERESRIILAYEKIQNMMDEKK
jgi:galactoside O-acetyltransferase